ncbi:F-type H+-transporting ATPase subunit delta [Catalinimonas alkaloidigena]|uniref:ATP synthase subunit delta n=1 Tax=Catalinimonas alkaloidigena TaxID=1075417 RepID=A0A1G9E8A8_9BACT|nr:ATP synthase F1 subunit delta [Catalinimonas alkaloidigena]SDK72285.1 F-type H+-transporting ATPase subunit delta [Catalinimonas alkaloidigena]
MAAENTRVAFRYAKSILELAQEKGMLEAIREDMELFDKAIRENRALANLLQSPIVNSDKKLKILQSIFKGKVNDLTLSVFEILTRKNRESQLPGIARSFHRQYNQLMGIENVTVITPMPLTDELRQQFMAMVKKQTGKEAELQEKVDPELIGGYILQIGDRRIDDSVRNRLHQLKRKFSENPYVAKY